MGSMDQKPSTILDTKLLIVQRERIIYIPKGISWIQLVLFLLLFYCSVDQVCHTMIKKSRKIGWNGDYLLKKRFLQTKYSFVNWN